MPRIAAALAVVGAIAFCIGFNTVRYPAVWEMLKNPGLLPVAKSADTATAPEPPAKSTQPAASTPNSTAAKQQAAKAESKAKEKGEDDAAEFCTADGVCHIAAGPAPAKKPDAPPKKAASREASPRDPDAPPELPRDPSLAGLGKTPGDLSAPAKPAAPAAATPQPSKSASFQGSSQPVSPGDEAPVKRRLVPVPDAPLPTALAVASGSQGGGNAGWKPLPPVEESGDPASGPFGPQSIGGATPFYPTTAYPAVDLSLLNAGTAGHVLPVGQRNP